MSIFSSNNPFTELFKNLKENSISLKIDGDKGGDDKKSEEKPKKDDGVAINDDSPDANGDGEVNAEDDLNGDGVVDAKDLKIIELQKDLQVRQLEKSLEDLDDPTPEPVEIVAQRLRIKDRGDKFVCIDQRGNEVKEFPYNNKETSSKEARYQAQRYVEKDYDNQIVAKHQNTKDQEKEMEDGEEEGEDGKDAAMLGKDTDKKKSDKKPVKEAAALDELSKKTLGSYVKKATGSAVVLGAITTAQAMSSKGKADPNDKRQLRNRITGVSKATDRLTREDFDLSEVLDAVRERMAEGQAMEDAINDVIAEAGYNDFPQTREEWAKRLPEFAKTLKTTNTGQLSTLTRIGESIIDTKTLDMLKGMPQDEASVIVRGLPKNIQRDVRKTLGIKEKVDGRTQAFKETAKRLTYMKSNKVEKVAETVDLAYLEEKIEYIKRYSLDNECYSMMNEVLDIEREYALLSFVLEAEDKKKPAKGKEPPPKEGEASEEDAAGEEAALAALEAAKKELKTKYGYDDETLAAASTSKKSGEEKPAKGAKEAPADKEGEAAPPKKGETKADATKKAEVPGDEEAAPKEKGKDPKAAAMDADTTKEPVPDAEGDEIEDFNGDGMNDEHEQDHAEEGGEFAEIDAKLDQIMATIDQMAMDDMDDMEEPSVRKGVGTTGMEEYDVVQGDETLMTGFSSAEEALTWIERNRSTIMAPPEESGATAGAEDEVAGDGNTITNVADKSSKPLGTGAGKPIKPAAGKPAPGGKAPPPKDKKPVKESVDFYADFISKTTPKKSLNEGLYHVSYGIGLDAQVTASSPEEAHKKAKMQIIKSKPKLNDPKYADTFNKKTITRIKGDEKHVKESEQVDELSKATLGSYRTKAARSEKDRTAGRNLSSAKQYPDQYKNSQLKAKVPASEAKEEPPKPRNPHSNDLDALRRSGAGGMHKDKKKELPRNAKHKGKMEEDNMDKEIQMSESVDFYANYISNTSQRDVLAEKTEQVDELSRKTLGSYVKNASRNLAGREYKRGAEKDTSTANLQKSYKRDQGIQRATDRLTREEAEQVDELSQNTLRNYHAAAGADRQKAKATVQRGMAVQKPSASTISRTSSAYARHQKRGAGMTRAANKMHENENVNDTDAVNESIAKIYADYISRIIKK